MGSGFPDMGICSVELNHMNKGIRRVLKDTLRIYRDACAFLSDVVLDRWPEISEHPSANKKLSFVEMLVHSTEGSAALYTAFDELFYKFPSYYRRAAINFAIGQVSSYKARLADYETRRKEAVDNGKKFHEKPPVFNRDTAACPAMYQGQMYMMDWRLPRDKVRIKAWIRNTWDWVDVSIPERDLKDFKEKSWLGDPMSPSLVFKYNKFYLAFPIKYPRAAFPKTALKDRRVLAVDLGVNRGATVCVMDAAGTIQGRHFDPFTSERDRMDHLINRIRRVQRETGNGNSLAAIYTKLDGVKTNYVRKLARWVADLAKAYGVYGVVLENLKSLKSKGKGARIHHWCRCRIRDLVKGMCLREGIRVFTVNPRNTSALAFDGSGPVSRGEYVSAGGGKKYNYSVCTFAGGKQYNCDLNAAYNIGARYFLREFQKSTDAKKWSELTAKVPGLPKRTSCTLSTLREVSRLLNAPADASLAAYT